ncbi:MAG TPA: aldolase/citrate lyase family protein [Jatrophihabitans sp.]|nr:aldolase/citrate lyase family protein [Jatrophihabitans sp.]
MRVDPCLFYTPALRVDAVLRSLPLRPGAGALVLDLEDSIPKPAKSEARARLSEVDLTGTGLPGVSLRINSIATPDGLSDIQTILALAGRIGGLPIETVLVPKVNTGSDVGIYRSLLSGLAEPPQLCSFIETVDAVENAFEIAAASDGLCFGQADLVAELYSPDESYLAHARARLCVAAAKYNLPAIDTNSFELWDMAVVRAQSEASRACGFTGKAAIHPRQVDVITDTFEVSAEELDGYRRTIADYEGDARGFNVTKDRVLAPPFVLKARRMLRLYATAATPAGDPAATAATPAGDPAATATASAGDPADAVAVPVG